MLCRVSPAAVQYKHRATTTDTHLPSPRPPHRQHCSCAQQSRLRPYARGSLIAVSAPPLHAPSPIDASSLSPKQAGPRAGPALPQSRDTARMLRHPSQQARSPASTGTASCGGCAVTGDGRQYPAARRGPAHSCRSVTAHSCPVTAHEQGCCRGH